MTMSTVWTILTLSLQHFSSAWKHSTLLGKMYLYCCDVLIYDVDDIGDDGDIIATDDDNDGETT